MFKKKNPLKKTEIESAPIQNTSSASDMDDGPLCFEGSLIINVSCRLNECQSELLEKVVTISGLKRGQYIRAAVLKQAYKDLNEVGLTQL